GATGAYGPPWELWRPRNALGEYIGPAWAWFIVERYENQSGYFRYSVRLKNVSSAVTFAAGTPVANFATAGSGIIRLSASDYGAPFIRTGITNAEPWINGEGTYQVQIGALYGLGYLDSDEAGAVIADDISEEWGSRLALTNKHTQIQNINMSFTDQFGNKQVEIKSGGATLWTEAESDPPPLDSSEPWTGSRSVVFSHSGEPAGASLNIFAYPYDSTEYGDIYDRT
ncbi:MAG: hypothetical protein KDE20_28330, partial [Caldilineaceae bacterium]|nr:hypothetical protein [Caldilineaceae bacterium]